MSITITIEKTITIERIKDLLCAAFEGGIGYWAAVSVSQEEIDKVKAEYYHEIPALGGQIILFDKEEVEDLVLGMETATPLGILDIESMKKAFDYMARGTDKNGKDCPRFKEHLADFLNDNEDADTGDVFVQLAVMGEIVFG
jgi:hypothetical protein